MLSGKRLPPVCSALAQAHEAEQLKQLETRPLPHAFISDSRVVSQASGGQAVESIRGLIRTV